MHNPSSIILLIIFTTRAVKFRIYIHVQSIIFFCIYLHFTSTHHHIHSIYWHTKVAKFWICVHVQSIIFFCIYLFFTFLILIFIAFINTPKGPNLNVHSWEIHHVLFHLSIFNILHHHHFHSIYKHPKKWSNPDCASIGNLWSYFSSIEFSHPSASSSFTQSYEHPKLVISRLCIHGQSNIFFCFHLDTSSSFSQHYKRLKLWSNPECACMGKSISSHELMNNFDQKFLWVYILSVLISVNLPPALHVQHFFFSIFLIWKTQQKYSKKSGEKKISHFKLEKEKFPKISQFSF